MTTRDETQPCCPGSIRTDYNYLGKETMLNETQLKLYVATPSSPSKHAILVSFDIFGFHPGGTREFCDKLAKAGYLVVMPDYYRGNAWSPSNFPPADQDEFMNWVKSFSPGMLAADVESTRQYILSQEPKITSIGLIGFCWGGKVAITASATGNFNASVLCHGSFLEDSDADGVQCPTLMLDAGADPDRSAILATLQAKPFGAACAAFKYDDMEHGWTIRGDRSNARVNECMDEAYSKTEAFFKEHL